jgi:hypothetical protein
MVISSILEVGLYLGKKKQPNASDIGLPSPVGV